MTTTKATSTIGMTLKQYDRRRFWELLDAYKRLKSDSTTRGRRAFIAVSIQLHIVSGQVPKSWRKYVNSAVRG